MAKKSQTDLKAKQKRQKIIAAVGGVLLVALLGLQAPKVMKMMHQKPAPLPPNALKPDGTPIGGPGAATPTTPSLAAPTLGAGTGTTTGGTSTTASSSDSGPASALAV